MFKAIVAYVAISSFVSLFASWTTDFEDIKGATLFSFIAVAAVAALVAILHWAIP